jgi:trigger factor
MTGATAPSRYLGGFLKTTVEQLEGNKVKLTVVVPAEEVDRQIDEAYSRVSGKVKIPGFRQGKAPKPMIDSHVGKDAVVADAQDEVLSSSYSKALDAEGLRPIAQPQIDELDTMVPGEDFSYEAEVEIRPEMKLTSIDGLSIEIPSAEVTEEEIAAQVDQYRDRFATLEEVEDRGVEVNDFVLLSFVGKMDGEDYQGNTVDKYLYEMGRGLMPEEFEDALLGKTPGDQTYAEFVVGENSTQPEYVGKTASFDVEVHEIKGKVLPEVDDEFATNVGFDSVDEMRESITTEISRAKEMQRARRREEGVREALAERLDAEVPEAMIQSTQSSMFRDFANGLESRGSSVKEYMDQTGLSLARIEEDLMVQAKASVEQELALEALSDQLGFEVTDEDVDDALSEMVDETGSVEELRAKWEDAGIMPVVHEQILQKKAIGWLMDEENVEVIDLAEQDSGADDSDSEEE